MIIHNPILTGSFTFNGTDVSSVTGSSTYSASFASSLTSLNTFTASAATTGSNTFVGNQVVSGSLTTSGSITATGTLTAQTLVVQTITSSVDYVTGSTRFGSLLTNTHVFSGSVTMNPGGLFVSGSGLVGIGTTAPNNLLEVGNTSTVHTMRIVAGSGNNLQLLKGTGPSISFQKTNATAQSWSITTDPNFRIVDDTRSADVFYIASGSGYVGVGTTSPNNKLTIYGGEIGSQISFTKDAPSSIYGRLGQDSNGTFLAQNARYDGSNWYRDTTASSSMAIALHNGNSRYEFRIAAAASNPINWTVALAINESSYVTTPGRIGIGTTSPISSLDVRGSHTGGYGMLNMLSTDSCILSLDSSASSDVRIRFKQLGTDKWFAGMNVDDSWELRVADNTSRFTVTQAGNVGIGTNAPNNGILSVVGNWSSGYATVKAYPTTAFSSGGLAGYGVFDSNGSTRKAFFAANSNQVEVWGQQNTGMVLATNDIERLLIDSSGRIKTPYQPSFYAYGVAGSTYGSGNYWIFPTTQHNRGGHYNTSNGIFTAPVAGVYFFAFGNLMGTNATVYRWYLRVNDSNTGAGPNIQLRMDRTGYSTSSYGWSHSKTAVINLAAGDTVRIFSSADDSSNLFPGGNNPTEEYPHFMGFLMG